MYGLIGDRLRRWLKGSTRPAEAAPAGSNGVRRLPFEVDGANGDSHNTQDMTPTPAGPEAAATPADSSGQVDEAKGELR